MANEYMTIEELKKLAEKKHIYIPSGYKKLDIIEYINEEIARIKGDKKKEKTIFKNKSPKYSPKSRSPARIHYAPVTHHQIYAPVNNIVNNYYTVPEIKEIAKANKIETPTGIRKEELIDLVNEILNVRLKNKTPIKIPKELSVKAKSKTISPKPKSPIKQQQPQQQKQQQKQQPQQQKQQQKQQPQQQKQQQPQKPASPKPKSKPASPKPKSKPVSPKPKSPTKPASPKPKSKSKSKKIELPELQPQEELPELQPQEELPELQPQEELPPLVSRTKNVSLPVLPSSPTKPKSIRSRVLPRVVGDEEE